MRAAGAVCIADEVQTGFGRTGGNMWGFAMHSVTPDIVTMGKPVANGHPLGVVVTRREIMESFMSRTSFFSTFGGNNVACAAGMAVLDVLEKEQLQASAQKVGEHLKAGLRGLMKKHDLIGDVRGMGLMIGVELVTDRKALTPATKETKRVLNLMRDHGVLVGYEGRAREHRQGAAADAVQDRACGPDRGCDGQGVEGSLSWEQHEENHEGGGAAQDRHQLAIEDIPIPEPG